MASWLEQRKKLDEIPKMAVMMAEICPAVCSKMMPMMKQKDGPLPVKMMQTMLGVEKKMGSSKKER
ncbi:MAG: hypothetical protein CMJ64_21590 [Planctomycetaceae bacterium]|nr:hypothetical protein [Planctomycetaceae bacterium]